MTLALDVLAFTCVVTQATAEANNLTAVAGAKDSYSKGMEQVSSTTNLQYTQSTLHYTY